ncbi:MAG: beta-lactamase family protein [Spirochaetaceae bacterium]
MNKYTLISVLVLLFFIIGCKRSEVMINSEQIISLDKDIIGWRQSDLFNGAVLMSQNDEIMFMKTYGYTDYTHTKKLTLQSSFRLASVSKQFTAAGIMILKDNNKLDFDDDITKYLPELKLIYKGITIRNLLNHTSGLQDYVTLAEKHRGDIEILTIPVVLNMFKEHGTKLRVPPGSKFEYSNTGYIFLSEIITRVSGLSFEDFLKKGIFEPLNMKNSSVVNLLSKDNVLPNRTKGFIGDLDNSYHWADGVSGDGSVFLSIEDFLLWENAIRENSIISESSWSEAISPVTLNNGKTSYYGFGWFLSEDSSFIEHGGSWLGARTYIKMDLKNRGLIVVLDSSSNDYVLHLADRMKKIYNSLLE